MTKRDPRSVEGSLARVQDRGREQGFESFAVEGVHLGSPDVVDGLVRQFLGEVIAARIDVHTDKITPEACQHRIESAASKYAGIFMGKDPDYAPSSWNTPAQLGAFIAANYANAGPPDQAVNALFLRLAADTMILAQEHEEEAVDDEVAEFRTDALVEGAVNTLLGLPEIEDEEE